MSDEIRPALTPEEWRNLDYRQNARAIDEWSRQKPERRESDDATQYVAQIGLTYDACVTLMSRAHDRVEVPPPARHALAALALHDQPFGFVAQDIVTLQWAADQLRGLGPPDLSAGLDELRMRIAALLA